jgi:ribonuclease Z
MELLFLGTSGYGVTQTRNLPSLIIDKKLLFDCGEGCLNTLNKRKIKPESLKAIFITHFHADHLLGLFSILYKLAFYSGNVDLGNKRKSPPIFIAKGNKILLQQIIESTSSTFGNTNYELDIRELEDQMDQPIKLVVDEILYKIEWILSNHTPKCLTFKVNNKLVYTGDTGPNPPLTKFIEGCHTLIHETAFPDQLAEIAHRVNHSTPVDAAKHASKAKIKSLIVFHVPDITKEQEIHFIAKAKEIFENIAVAHDGDELHFD